MSKYIYRKIKIKCVQCRKFFEYKAKVYKSTGKPVRIRTVCDKCIEANDTKRYLAGRVLKGKAKKRITPFHNPEVTGKFNHRAVKHRGSQ